ncbi:MAG: methylamine utilization protein [Methylococcales bacterium]|nr:methylamine utilization protein [Methylococcales bacterium]
MPTKAYTDVFTASSGGMPRQQMGSPIRHYKPGQPLGACLLFFTLAAQAAALVGEVTDQSGQPLADAVVAAFPVRGLPSPASPATAVLDQRNREFIPHVLVVRTGTEVSFPNHDHIRHHVYSFSPAKRFEIKLYQGTPPDPVRFDTAGVAALGCNIHDWMLAYILVTDSPYFTLTDSQGRWRLELPDDAYRLSLWHPDMEQDDMPSFGPLTPATTPDSVLHYRLAVKRKLRNGKPPDSLQIEGYKGEP